ncbi:MAG: phosphoenolpyruvate carboxykinase (ATP) [Fimbriimonadaceae bacterium]|nr:phosphoenolpyruvate carboxykinase (ATP) [Fimbriimonadaceae bacterium]
MTVSSPLSLSGPLNLDQASELFTNLSSAVLVEHAVRQGDKLADNGALVAYTGKYTGRTPKDKFTVRDAESEGNVWWDNNAAMEPETFKKLLAKANEYVKGKKLYVVDTFGGADPEHRIKARFIVQRPYHALFIKTLLIRPELTELATYVPDWTVIDLCELKADPAVDGTRSEAVIALNFAEKTVLIMGTHYAGEMKKSVFTILNYLLPLKGVLSMHCSANIGEKGDTALFFGLSGTGKTTLSADPTRRLIGDDEHGWDEKGVFNFEGGCYAKCIKLSKQGEPQIWDAIRFGSVLENVVLNSRNEPDYDDGSLTENTRCAYPVEYIEGAVIPSIGGHPENICFLTCDAFGVLPPISRLNPEQAMYHFLNGYTAKVAGTEADVTEPQVTFSTCFGAPFLPLPPARYAKLLGEKIAKHNVRVWLINTGWSGGPYGVGNRMKLSYTRAMIHAAFSGVLDNVEYATDPVFGLSVPTTCPNVPDEVLLPRSTWEDKEAYDAKATELRAMFENNYKKFS